MKRTNLLSEKVGVPWLRRFIRGAMLRSEAVRNYNPEVYDGVITLYRSMESEPESEKAWRELGIDVEYHIEQGPVLENESVDIGVVEIVGVKRWEVTIEGCTNHAGTTPMSGRKDAGCRGEVH